MKNKPANNDVDTRPILDIRRVPLLSCFKSTRAMRISSIKAAIPDLSIAAAFLYAIVMFPEITPEFKSNMEGVVIIELIVLIMFPFFFRVLATDEKNEFRSSRKMSFMTGWINVFNLFFVLAIMIELAWLTSIAEGRSWIPLQLLILSGTKIYTVFFADEKKVKPKEFCARMTARLVCGLFFGLFTYFFAVIPLGLITTPAILSEIGMLLVGYVYFIMMGIFSLFKQEFLYALESQDKEFKETDDKKMIFEVTYPRIKEKDVDKNSN